MLDTTNSKILKWNAGRKKKSKRISSKPKLKKRKGVKYRIRNRDPRKLKKIMVSIYGEHYGWDI